MRDPGCGLPTTTTVEAVRPDASDDEAEVEKREESKALDTIRAGVIAYPPMRADPAPGPFAAATAVTADPALPGRWSGIVEEGWDVVGNAHGGYLLSIAARALSAATDRPDPVTITAHYLSPGRPGPVVVDTTVLRSGRRFATATALVAGERPLLAVLGTFGDLADEVPGPELMSGRPPELPAPDECLRVVPGDPFPPSFMAKVELRLHPEDAQFLAGKRSGTPRIRGWFRLLDDEPMTTNSLLCAVDAFPPTIFNSDLPIGWTPTVELTAHVRARPEPGWLACGFTTRFVTGGFLEADGEIWDGAGRLVAQSRQLALVPRG